MQSFKCGIFNMFLKMLCFKNIKPNIAPFLLEKTLKILKCDLLTLLQTKHEIDFCFHIKEQWSGKLRFSVFLSKDIIVKARDLTDNEICQNSEP